MEPIGPLVRPKLVRWFRRAGSVVRGADVMRAAVGAGVVVAAVSGCGGGAEKGSAQPTTRDLDSIVVFNVCSQLEDEALASSGLDPATKRTLTDPPTGPSAWRVCNWQPADDRYGVGLRKIGVFSTSHTLDDARVKEDIVDVQDTMVVGRPGLTFREKNDPDGCFVAFAAEQGMFEVRVSWISNEGPRIGDVCDMAAKYAANLAPHLPK
ncbi:DUF3558 domain-containing protein [Nocardia sp. IBHARD005]|uniref:DUF3558 domain-containing protein n=1 Tax=Nocardia sp. IBHARD005 TaxID=3457765 RepID=UPI0040592DFE